MENNKIKTRIALALIVNGVDSEAHFLKQSLVHNARHFDGIFITVTHLPGKAPSEKISKTIAQYAPGSNTSYFTWCDDFAAARNFNFAQVPKEFEYIAWCDADDVLFDLSGDKLRKTIEQDLSVDAWTMQYYYERDANFNPTVIHTKTQVLRNDGCVSWTGRIHEDFKEHRKLKVAYIGDIKRIHITNSAHAQESAKRNVRIALKDLKDRPNDPQAYFNLGNSYLGVADYKKAKPIFLEFLKTSQSPQEKYAIYQRLGKIEARLGNRQKAIEYLQTSIGLYPEFPDSYNQLGYLLFDFGMVEEAGRYLLMGLVIKPQYQKMLVYNPRDYDYNPMMALSKIFFRQSRPDLALPMLKGCLTIYPDDTKLQGLVKEMEAETTRLEKVVEAIKRIATYGEDKDKILFEIRKLPEDLQSHPAICKIRNQYEVKTTSSGKDIAYYCGETVFEWNPELFKTKGFGGSEEAVINLAKEWAKKGYSVTVYNSCGIQPVTYDGVTYKPWWMFNHRDKWDNLVLWRTPGLTDYDLNAGKIFVDLHDVVPEGEFTEKRLKKIEKIFVKTKAHRVLYPNIPDEKFEIIGNGIDLGLFKEEVKREPFLLVNTSSPDRSMDTLAKLFKEVKKQVPMARLVWCYGWDNFDKWYSGREDMMKWRNEVAKDMEDAGIEDLGRLPQHEAAKIYQRGRIFAYPSDFYEIFCISLVKAQAAGCFPVTTNFAAIGEMNKFGISVPTDRNISNWSGAYQFGFGTKDAHAQKAWVDAVVKVLKSPMKENDDMKKWAQEYSWEKISSQWLVVFKI